MTSTDCTLFDLEQVVDNSAYEPSLSATTFPTIHLQHTWSIIDFPLMRAGDMVRSNRFGSYGINPWFLTLSLISRVDENTRSNLAQTNIHLSLHCDLTELNRATGQQATRARCKLTIVTNDRPPNEVLAFETIDEGFLFEGVRKSIGYRFSNMTKEDIIHSSGQMLHARDVLNNEAAASCSTQLSANGKAKATNSVLVIRCRLSCDQSCYHNRDNIKYFTLGKPIGPSFVPREFSLQSDIAKLQQSSTYSAHDVDLLSSEGLKISANSFLLSARSGILRTMISTKRRDVGNAPILEEDGVDTETDNRHKCAIITLDFSEYSAASVKHIVNFIYRDAVADLDANTAVDLLYAGDSLKIPGLKVAAESFLISHCMSRENETQLLELADVFESSYMRAAVEAYRRLWVESESTSLSRETQQRND